MSRHVVSVIDVDPPRARVRHLPLTRAQLCAALGAVLAVAAFLAVGSAVAGLRQGDPAIPSSAPAVLVVQPGDTLWSIAQRIAPAQDPRAVVAELRQRNGLGSAATVWVGERLRVR